MTDGQRLKVGTINSIFIHAFYAFVAGPVMLLGLPLVGFSYLDDNKDKKPLDIIPLRWFLQLLLLPFIALFILPMGILLLLTWDIANQIEEYREKTNLKILGRW